MSKKTKGWLIAAIILVLLGFGLFTAAMAASDWDFTELNTAQYETNTHKIGNDFSNIFLHTDTADIFFVPSGDGTCSVTCHELEYAKHTVTVQDDTLIIREVDTRKWYQNIGVTTGTPQITVSLPDVEYSMLFIKESTGDIEVPDDFRFESMDITTSTGDVTNRASTLDTMKISASTGDIYIENVTAASLDLSVSTGLVTVTGAVCTDDVSIRVSSGRAKLTDIICGNLFSSGNTGDIFLRNILAAGKFSIERSTGDVEFDGCDAAEIYVTTDTGNVRGSLRSDKVFSIQTDTGDVDVPQTMSGGICEIKTDTGDIRIEIQ